MASEVKGWTKTRISREAGLGKNCLRDLFNNGFNPTADTLIRVESVLERAGFLPAHPCEDGCESEEEPQPDVNQAGDEASSG